MERARLHATAVAVGGEAILIRGAPGSGKSTLALELIDVPGNGLDKVPIVASLIADDQTEITLGQGHIWCSAPEALAGLLEIRGIGIVNVRSTGPAPLKLVVDLVPAAEAPRLPDQEHATANILGKIVPRIILESTGRALAARVRAALTMPSKVR